MTKDTRRPIDDLGITALCAAVRSSHRIAQGDILIVSPRCRDCDAQDVMLSCKSSYGCFDQTMDGWDLSSTAVKVKKQHHRAITVSSWQSSNAMSKRQCKAGKVEDASHSAMNLMLTTQYCVVLCCGLMMFIPSASVQVVIS